MKKISNLFSDSKLQKWIPISILIAMGIVYLASRLYSDGQRQTEPPQNSDGTAASRPAPAFTLTDVQGRSVSLSDYRGKVVILDFWATWCPPCRKEIPDFIALQQEYASRGVQIIGIGLDEPDKIQEFVHENGINYTILLGSDDISNLYGGVSGIPTTFIIDRQGNIVNRFEGFTSRLVFENEIRRLL